MRILFIAVFLFVAGTAIGQQVDSVNIPKGVVYKYCDPAIVEKAKELILKELGSAPSYKLNSGVMFVGPTLWKRYKNIPALGNIPGGNVTINFNKEQLSAKMTQDAEGFEKIWTQVRKEVAIDQVKIRKAGYGELQYYWAVISFDIDEPLLIAETNEHRYLLNLSAKDLTLVWLDEVPAFVK